MTTKPSVPPEMTLEESDRHVIEPEDQSLFGTRRPRPMSVGRHLLVVLVCFLLALGVAIFYAESAPNPESGTPKTSISPQP